MKKVICLFLLGSVFLLHGEQLPKYEVVIDRCGLAIDTPALAKREILKLRLENGLEALLISDPETNESGAALAVGVGSWDDPEDRPGMAHFVEHLLFLGTEKYPEEEGYSRYLDEHGGSRNAFTMADRTVYSFSVNNDGFLAAMDRFGQFFISPLFNPSGVERESKAIHQEFCKDLPLDPWRMLYVKKELGNPQHPFHRFCIGNQETLAKISQDELKQWYAAHYSANLMHLIVYSSLDLPTLEKEVVSLFSAVKNKQKMASNFSVPLITHDPEPKLCVISPKQEVQLLELTWEIPRFYGQDLEIHADKLLSHVLGHEGSTSLLAQLKRENLAESLAVGNFRAGRDQCLLSLSIDLTTKGLQEYERVIERCFEAIATLRHSGIPRYIFEEVCQISELGYRFQSREEVFEFVSNYATKMVDEPLETYPHQTLIPSSHNPEKVKGLIDHLTPQACRYTLVASPELTKVEPTHKEKWMGVEYAFRPISSEKMKKWEESSLHMAMSIPRPNPFLPVNLKIKQAASTKSSILPKPKLIHNDGMGKIYAAEDTEFLVPEVCWNFTFKTPQIADSDPLSHVYADLYCHSVQEVLKTSSYEALMGGLGFTLEPKHDGLELTLVGYSDKAHDLLKTVLSAMKSTCPTEEQYVLYAEQMGRDYVNTLNASPLKEGKEVLLGILFKEYPGLEQKSAALKTGSYEALSAFCHNVLKECYVEGMLYGNSTQAESIGVWEMVKHSIHSLPYPRCLHSAIAMASFPSQEHSAYLAITSENPANALILTADCGQFSFKRRAAQEILTKGLEEPFFSELRTKQQTGYAVGNWSQEVERHLYSFFAVQSSSHDPRDLLARFELFIESSLQELSEEVIPEERFDSIRNAYIKQLERPAENLVKMGQLLYTIAFQYDGDFSWTEKRIEAFRDLTYAEFVDYAKEFLGKENTRRLAICVKGNLPQKEAVAYTPITTPEKLRSEICYKERKAPPPQN